MHFSAQIGEQVGSVLFSFQRAKRIAERDVALDSNGTV
jgi:hypothetical protein